MVACEPGLSDISKVRCWSLGNNSAIAASLAPSSTTFSYSWSVTPAIASLSSTALQPGQALGVTGAVLGNVVEFQFRQGSQIWARAAATGASANFANTTVPSDLPAGRYSIVLRTSSGELSVDPDGVASLAVYAFLNDISQNRGSLGGGTAVTLTINGTSWNSTQLANNDVTIGGSRCLVTSASGSTLQCTTRPVVGRVRAEYWNLPANSAGVDPDVINFVRPVVSRVETSLNLNWGSNSPAVGINNNFFAGRFTFFLQIAQAGTYNFFLGADDVAK